MASSDGGGDGTEDNSVEEFCFIATAAYGSPMAAAKLNSRKILAIMFY